MFDKNKFSNRNRLICAAIIFLLIAFAWSANKENSAGEASKQVAPSSEAQITAPVSETKNEVVEQAITAQKTIAHAKHHRVRPPHVPEQRFLESALDAECRSEKPVQLTWQDSAPAKSYTVEISGNFDFDSLTYSQEATQPNLQVQKVKQGRYFWRVIAHRDHQPDQVSNVGDVLVVDQIPKERVPAAATPLPSATPLETPPPTPIPTPIPVALALATSTPAPQMAVAKTEVIVIQQNPPAPVMLSPVAVKVRATPEPLPQQRAPVVVASESTPHKIGMRIGFGLSSVYENITENLSDVIAKYHKTLSPGIRVEAGLEATDTIDVEALYRSVQIHFDNSSIADNDTRGQWNSMGANLSIGTKHGAKEEWRLKLGAAMEQLPISLFNSEGTTGYLRNLMFNNVTVGVGYKNYLNPWTRFSFDGGLQFPLSSTADTAGAQLSVRPRVFFDTDIGLDKRIFKNGWLGLHWVGTYRTFNFTYQDSIVVNGGTECFFLSAFELRFNYEF